jgi:hypothetical protein
MNENVCSPESRTEVIASPATRQPPLDWELCVVCGHGVEPGRRASRINHLGNTVNLCGPQCLRAFASDPAPYLGRLARVMRERAWKTEPEAS